jgi:phosphate transport system permease protein
MSVSNDLAKALPAVHPLVRGARLKRRRISAALFALLCWASTWMAVILLAVLLYSVARDGAGWLFARVETHPYVMNSILARDASFMAAAEAALPGFTARFQRDPGYLGQLAQDTENTGPFEKISQAADALGEGQGFVGHANTVIPGFLGSYAGDPPSFLYDLRKDDPDAFELLGIHAGWQVKAAALYQATQSFLGSFPSRKPEIAGIKSAWVGSLWLIALTTLFSVPLGVAAAVYLEEYAHENRISRLIEVNIANLAGVPSIVYGLLGLTLFVGFFSYMKLHHPDSPLLQAPNNIIAGSLTMTLVILPVIIISAREAIRAVPGSLRQAAFALGATRWQVVGQHVLPAAIPGIVTGVILSLSRAIGETAPLITIGALTYVAFLPKSPLDGFTVLPIQIYNWVSRPQEDFQYIAALGIIALLVILLVMNSVAIAIRHHYERKIKW